jgi:LuxR family maltose regulon positive regulatory protein
VLDGLDPAIEAQRTKAYGARERPAAPFPLLTSKLAPPFARPGQLERTAVLQRLASQPAPPVVSLVAPAGYGKSTVLRQWADRTGRPTAWLALDADDNDPVVLLTYLAAALDRITPVDPELFRLLVVEDPSVTAIARRLGTALAAWPWPGVLLLDDVHQLENPTCHDILALLVAHVPAGATIAFASRAQPPLPMPRLRAQGRILEFGPAALALGYAEAATLLEADGVTLPEPDVRALVDVAEGWPVAVYLAGRTVRARGREGTFDVAHVGRSRQIAAYAHAELLSALPERTVQFLTRSSVLDRMSGPLCDAALRTFGSADRLEEMAQADLLVTPVDEHREWYRYHHLFRDLLRAELEQREPERIPGIHRRAAQWCQVNGLPDAAAEYAMSAGDVDRAAQIVQQRILPLYRAGRVVTLGRWLDWFDAGGHMRSQPRVAVAGAWLAALTGRAAAAERWADAAEGAQEPSDADDPSLGGQLPLLRAMLCRDGIDRACTDAEAAVRLIPSDSAWRATALTMLGLVQLVTGSIGEADRALTEAVQVGQEIGAMPASSVALGERAVLALDRGDADGADAHIARACAVVEEGRLQEHVTNVFIFAVAAHVAMSAGDMRRAETLVISAQRLRPRLTYAIPHLAVQARLELARTMLSLADVAGARTVLREVDDILRLRPKLGVLVGEAEELRTQLAGAPTGTIGASSLTAAELRLLPLLRTHLSFREIGERLFVSHNTVKTQAISIYRKLGVSSRSDAMQVASEIGLLLG